MGVVTLAHTLNSEVWRFERQTFAQIWVWPRWPTRAAAPQNLLQHATLASTPSTPHTTMPPKGRSTKSKKPLGNQETPSSTPDGDVQLEAKSHRAKVQPQTKNNPVQDKAEKRAVYPRDLPKPFVELLRASTVCANTEPF